MEADILVIGTPIWLGVKSSVATLVIECMYAYSGDYNDKEQYAYYGKTAGCIITGNEDGVKHCAMDFCMLCSTLATWSHLRLMLDGLVKLVLVLSTVIFQVTWPKTQKACENLPATITSSLTAILRS